MHLSELKALPIADLITMGEALEIENVQRLRDGAGPISPVKPLLRAIAKATDMTSVAAGSNVQISQPSGVAARIGMNLADNQMPVVSTGRPEAVTAFLPLRTFVGTGDGAPIDEIGRAHV